MDTLFMTRTMYLVSIVCLCISLTFGQMPLHTGSDRSSFYRSPLERYKYKPKQRNLEYDRLIRRMGENFDPEWMSVNLPTEEVASQDHHKGSFENRIANKLSRANFTYVDDNGEFVVLKDIERHAVEKWLLKRASCPVEFRWEDLSELFWPRYVKSGYCNDNKGCSWPPGMRCVPANSRAIKILNWQCRPNKRKRKTSGLHVRYGSSDYANKTHAQLSTAGNPSSLKRKQVKRQRKRAQRSKQKIKCRWNKVRYPVTTECYCSC